VTGAFVAGLVVGYLSLGLALAFAIGSAMRRADEADLQAARKQPTGVRDPKTGLLWDETGRLEAWL
jgi:hypothetical protein